MAKQVGSRKTLEQICSQINKDFGEVIAGKNLKFEEAPRIPFTSPRLNYMTYGGIPRGRIHEFLGEENGGKTTTALDVVANAQRVFNEEWELGSTNLDAPLKVVYVDVEMTLDEQWAKLLGVNFEDMYLLKPLSQSADEIFDAIILLIETGEVGLVIIDSIGAMISAQEQEKDVGESSYAGISKPLTIFSKKAAPLCHALNCTIIGINQVRDDLKNPYNMYNTPGGRAWKFFCSTRLNFRKGDYIDAAGARVTNSTEDPVGNKVEVNVVKTKAFPPNRRLGFYTLKYSKGIDEYLDLVDTAIRYGIIKMSGAWASFYDLESGEVLTEDDGEKIRVQGRANVAAFMEKDEFVHKFVKEQVEKQTAGD